MQLNEIGGYQILDLIGEGGQGAVYRAQDPASGQIVAVKVLSASISDGEFLERFQREASILATIQHPNIIQVFDHGEENGQHYIVTEFVTENLERILERGGKLPIQRAVAVTKQVAAALAVSHSSGITHRDIKPANVLITDSGDVKLIDFGIASAEVLSKVTNANATVGTPLYMSPEQIQGEGVDSRTDIYSLGCVLYQMLTAEPPFNGKSDFDILNGHMNNEPPPLNDFLDEFPPELEETLLKSLAKDNENRFQSAEELITELEKVEKILSEGPATVARTRVMPKGLGTQVMAKTPATPAKSSAKSNSPVPMPVLAVVGIVVLLVAGGGGFFFLNQGDTVGLATGADSSSVPPQASIPEPTLPQQPAPAIIPEPLPTPSDPVVSSSEPKQGEVIISKDPMSIDEELISVFEDSNEVHEIPFEGVEGQIFNFSMIGASTGDVDAYIELLDPKGKIEVSDDDSGGNYNARISEWTIRQTGTYTIRLYSGGGVGDYVFNITQFDATMPIASGIPYLNPNIVNFDDPTSSDTGQSDTDNITNANTIYLSVEHPNINPESDEVIFYRGNDIFLGECLPGSNSYQETGICTISNSDISEGEHQIYTKILNDNDVFSEPSPVLMVTVDRSITSPSKPDMTRETDTGASSTDDLTSSLNPEFTGIADPLAYIELVDGDGLVLGSTTAGNTGLWSIISETLSDGEYVIIARSQDVAGNQSDLSEPVFVKIESTASAPSDVDLMSRDDSGESNSDNITKNPSPVFEGKSSPGIKIELLNTRGQVIGETTVSESGKWSIKSEPLDEGPHEITARSTDAVGNVTESEIPLKITIDTEISTPSKPDLSDESDTGQSDSDNVTTDTSPTFKGTSDPTTLIELFVGSAVIGTGYSDSRGIWSITTEGMFGKQEVYAVATDRAGNESSSSSELLVEVLVQGVGQSSAPQLVASSDSGRYSYDGITNESTPSFTGNAKPDVNVALFDTRGNQLGSSTVRSNGVWTLKSSYINDGKHDVYVILTDEAGNEGDPSPSSTVNIDTQAPSGLRQPILFEEGDSDSPTIIGGTFTEEALIEVVTSDGYFIGETEVEGSSWDLEIFSLQPGDYLIQYFATDIAGNMSQISPGLPIIIKGQSIQQPEINSIEGSTENGTWGSSYDSTFTDGWISISGTSEPFHRIEIFDSSNGRLIGESFSDFNGNWYSQNFDFLSIGKYSIYAISYDPDDGFLSIPSEDYNFEIIPSPPPSAPSKLSMVYWDNDSQRELTGTNTSERFPCFRGQADQFTEVVLQSEFGEIGRGWSDYGQWNICPQSEMPIGEYAVWAYSYDPDDRQRISDDSDYLYIEIFVETLQPPSGLSMVFWDNDARTQITGTSTSERFPCFRGQADQFTEVVLQSEFGEIGQGWSDYGEWNICSKSEMPIGEYAIWAYSYDPGDPQRVSDDSDYLYIEITSENINAPRDLTMYYFDNDSGREVNAKTITRFQDPFFRGFADSNSEVILWGNGRQLGKGYADYQGSWTIYPNGELEVGSYEIWAESVMMDQYSNNQIYSEPSETLFIEVTEEIRNAPVIGGMISEGEFTSTSYSPNVSFEGKLDLGNNSGGAYIDLYTSDGTFIGGTFISQFDGNYWNIDDIYLEPGKYQLYAIAYYENGGNSEPSDYLSIEIMSQNSGFNQSSNFNNRGGGFTSIGDWSGKTGTVSVYDSNDIFIEGLAPFFWSITSANAQNAYFYPNANLVAGINSSGCFSGNSGYKNFDNVDLLVDANNHEFSSTYTIGICTQESSNSSELMLMFNPGTNQYGLLEFAAISNSNLILNYWVGDPGVTNFSGAPQVYESDFGR